MIKRLLVVSCLLLNSIHTADAVLSPDEETALSKPLRDLDAVRASQATSLDVLKKDIQSLAQPGALPEQVDALSADLESRYKAADLQNKTEAARKDIDSKEKLARAVALNDATTQLAKAGKDTSLAILNIFNTGYPKLADQLKKLKNAQAAAQQSQTQQQQSSNEFKKTYDTVKGALDLLKTQINSFSDARKSADLMTVFMRTASEIDALYIAVSVQADAAAIKNATLSMNVKLNALQSQVQDVAKQLNIAQAVERAEATRKQQEETRKRFFALLATLQPVIKNFSQQQERIKSALIKQAATGAYDQPASVEIIQNAQAIMQAAAQAYQANSMPVAVTDTLNYVVAAYRQLVQYCLDDMALTAAQVNRFFANHKTIEQGFAPLAQLAARVDGYTALLQKIATDYFHDAAQDALSEYRHGKERITLKTCLDALQQLVTTVAEPTAEQVGYARTFHALIQDNFDVLDQKVVVQWKSQIGVALAVFLVARARVVLQSMSSTADNATALQEVTTLYTQAASYYKETGDERNAIFVTQYTAAADFLTAGQQSWQQATSQEQTQNIAGAIDAYQRATTSFQQAGDTVNAARARTRGQSLVIVKNYREGQSVLQEYAQKQGALFNDYVTFLGNPAAQTLAAFDRYAPLYTALEAAYETASARYAAARAAYADLGATQLDGALAQGLAAQLAALPSALAWLSNMHDASVALRAADTLLRGIDATSDGVLNAFGSAQAQYTKALQASAAADKIYQDVIAVHDSVLSLFAQSASLVMRHRAAYYNAVAAQPGMPDIVALLCYSNALAQGDLLDADMRTYLQGKLDSLKAKAQELEQFFTEAQKHAQEAQALTPADWQSDGTSVLYASKATALWRSVLTAYAHAYTLGKQEAQALFLSAVDAYSTAYNKAALSADYFPELGQALVLYNGYVVAMLMHDDSKAQQFLAQMQPLVEAFFAHGTALQQSAAALGGATIDALQEAIKKQEQCALWQKNMDNALLDQQAVIALFDAGKDAELLSKVASADAGAVTYSFNNGQKSVVVNDVQVVAAQLQELLGSRALADKEYGIANSAFSAARTAYQMLGKTAQVAALDANFKLSVTLAAAQQWRDLVIPNKKDAHGISTVSVAGIAVPEKYALQLYEQQYPFAVPVGFDALAQATTQEQKSQLQAQLVGMVTTLYLANVLQTQNIAIQNAIDLASFSVKSSVPAAQMPVIQKAVEQANAFKADLEKRIASKESALYVLKKEQAYYIGESYKPIFAVPPVNEQGSSLSPYAGYPVAQNYYANAYTLFRPDRPGKTVAGITYETLSNDRDSALDALRLYANTSLSAGEQYKKSASAPDSAQAQTLSAIKGFSGQAGATLSSYMGQYDSLKKYYTNLVIKWYAAAYPLYSGFLNDAAAAKNLGLLLFDTYVQLGDTLSQFLVGTPLNSDYSRTVLPDIEGFYRLATSYDKSPDKTKALYKKLAALYNAAGKQLVDQGDFIYALSFLSHVEQLYKEITNPDTEIVGLTQAATLAKFEAMFYGSTQKIKNFADKYFAGQPYFGSTEQRPLITVKLFSGQSGQYTFGQLQQKNMPLMGGIDQLNTDAGEIKMYTEIQSMILDSLIFYSACSSGAAAQAANATDLVKATTDIIATYFKDNAIVLSTLDGAQQFLSRKDAQEKIMGCFAIFKQKIQQGADKNLGYVGIAQLANQLYTAFAQVYINDFYGGAAQCPNGSQECIANQQAEQWASLKAAIDAEMNAIKAPSSLYI